MLWAKTNVLRLDSGVFVSGRRVDPLLTKMVDTCCERDEADEPSTLIG